MRVYDFQDRERDWAYLTAQYGRLLHLQSQRASAYALVQVNETQGPSNLKVRVVDDLGAPAQVMVVLTWPTLAAPAGDLPDLTQGDQAADAWSRRGVAQFTDGSGYTGFGLGTESWIKDLAAGGPYHVWIFHPTHGSDCLSCIGWLGGTDHRGPCSLTFKLRAGGGTTDPGGTPDEPGTLPTEIVPLLQEQLDVLRQIAAHIGVSL